MVEVCPDCDMAGCTHIRNRTGAFAPPSKNWLIISWAHKDHMDGSFGYKIDQCYGTREQAEELARYYVGELSPIGIVEEIV